MFFCVVLLCIFTHWVPCCDVRYNFRMKMMFGSSLSLVVCGRVHVHTRYLVYVICVCNVYSGVQHIHVLCCVFVLFCFSSSCVPYIASFSGLFFLAHLAKGNVSFCHHLAPLDCLRPMSCVSNVASFSGFSSSCTLCVQCY